MRQSDVLLLWDLHTNHQNLYERVSTLVSTSMLHLIIKTQMVFMLEKSIFAFSTPRSQIL